MSYQMMAQVRYRPQMTQAMLDEVEYFDEHLYEEIVLCVAKANDCAAAADIHLPATAASGEAVVHGARCEADALVDYWLARLRAVSPLIGTDAFRACIQGFELHPSVTRKMRGQI